MKTEVHPQYHSVVVTCACGNQFTTGSTRDAIRVEICYNCHPFYTGQAKFVDTEGRVEAFKRREVLKVEKKETKKPETREENRPKSLKEMLQTEG
jgi:large subunit ribosomal protein L31